MCSAKNCCGTQAKVSYLDSLLAENTLTDEQLTMLVWEEVIEAADTTLVTTEWAMYELAKNPDKQVGTTCCNLIATLSVLYPTHSECRREMHC